MPPPAPPRLVPLPSVVAMPWQPVVLLDTLVLNEVLAALADTRFPAAAPVKLRLGRVERRVPSAPRRLAFVSGARFRSYQDIVPHIAQHPPTAALSPRFGIVARERHVPCATAPGHPCLPTTGKLPAEPAMHTGSICLIATKRLCLPSFGATESASHRPRFHAHRARRQRGVHSDLLVAPQLR